MLQPARRGGARGPAGAGGRQADGGQRSNPLHCCHWQSPRISLAAAPAQLATPRSLPVGHRAIVALFWKSGLLSTGRSSELMANFLRLSDSVEVESNASKTA